MGDASLCNELSLGSREPSGDGVRLLRHNESESNFQDQAWLPLPTAFDTITTTIQDMKEETPARPISPTSEAGAALESRSVTTEAESTNIPLRPTCGTSATSVAVRRES